MAIPVSAQKEDRVLFASGPNDYAVRDVVDAAYFRGELEDFWNDLLTRLEAERFAQDAEVALDKDALDEASIAFRYQYDLITAEETEQWLDARALTLGDFSEYFARALWAKTLRGQTNPELIPFAQASSEQRELLAVELTLTGELDRLATRLGWRVAIREAGAAEGIEPSLIEAERALFAERAGVTKDALADWLRAFGRDEVWLEENIAMEAAYERECAKVLTKEACEREVSALRLPLTRLEMEMIELDSRDSAYEAFLCVRDDGMSMEDVAQEGRYPYRRTELMLEEIPDELQQKFLSLSPGNVLEPTARDDGFVLSRLIGKVEPKADAPEVRARIERRILERHFSDLMSGRIQWRFLFNAPE